MRKFSIFRKNWDYRLAVCHNSGLWMSYPSHMHGRCYNTLVQTEIVSLLNPSVRECEARVADSGALETGERYFIPDKTCFFPEGGGQPSDAGFFKTADGAEFRVARCKKRDDGAILHFIDAQQGDAPGCTPEAGDEGSLILDWEYCHKIRRYHTALHVLCAVIWREFGVKVTGSQSRGDSARMDFGFPDWTPEYAARIEAKVNEAVATGAPVKIYSLPAIEARKIPDLIRTDVDLLPEGLAEIRIVEIEEIDVQADGGPHVSSLAEVGEVRIVKVKNKGAGFRRLEIALA